MIFYGREDKLNEIERFIKKSGSGFTHLRGRRRIGKTAILREVENKVDNCFRYTGKLDMTTLRCLGDFAKKWDDFRGSSTLSDLKKDVLSWDRIFTEVNKSLIANKKKLVFILDEVQWISKTSSGFIGALKNAWDEYLNKSGKVKIIVCGSSNKFFLKNSGGEEAILRGLRTHSEIIVNEFSIEEVKKYYFPGYTNEQVALVYMMLGGVPYYLEQIINETNFLRSINLSIFTKDSIFIEEVDEILKLEFNANGRKNVKKILMSLGQDGSTEKMIQYKIGIPQSTINGLLRMLEEYNLIYSVTPYAQNRKAKEHGTKYAMHDHYLNFYFQVLDPLRNHIKNNVKGQIFSSRCITSKIGYYIPNFSGKAFELLIKNILNNNFDVSKIIFKKLKLHSCNYSVSTYWDKENQIDIIVENYDDKEIIIVECKWVNQLVTASNTFIQDVVDKKYLIKAGYTRANCLILSNKCTEQFYENARNNNVELIFMDDLF